MFFSFFDFYKSHHGISQNILVASIPELDFVVLKTGAFFLAHDSTMVRSAPHDITFLTFVPKNVKKTFEKRVSRTEFCVL